MEERKEATQDEGTGRREHEERKNGRKRKMKERRGKDGYK